MDKEQTDDDPRQEKAIEVIEVAIVGGGCAAMAAAFELSDPKHQGKYHVTVYQQGWRLGGKGASGRGASQRIEEHGLHLWMGFYENAFRIMRECYAELDRDPKRCPISQWHEAFKPDPYIALTDDNGNTDDWAHWIARFPPLPGLPGDPIDNHNPYTVPAYLQRCVWLIRVLLESLDDQGSSHQSNSMPPMAGNIAELINRFSNIGQLATLTALSEGCRLLESAFRITPLIPQQTLQELLHNFHSALLTFTKNLTDNDPSSRRLWEIVDIILAAVRGCVRYGLLTHPRGFDAINDYDWREWLRDNGASEAALKSAFLRASYDLLFAYEDGDVSKPRLAAGQALRGAFRMFFSYRGAVFYKMQAGMGDIVFAPFYEVLKDRGVTFKFFHRLRKASLSKPDVSDPHIETLRFDIQAKPLAGKEYEPLVDVHGLPCWPAKADYSQLQDGKKLARDQVDFESHWETTSATTRTLRVGRHFDLVILAVGYGELPYVVEDIIERNPKWRTMLDQIKSVETQAFQIWLNEDMAQLGWDKPPVNLSGFVEPFDTWADMTHLIPVEDWQAPVKSIAYFCSVLPDSDLPRDKSYPVARESQVRRGAIDFLNNDIRHLWPDAVLDKGQNRFRWTVLVGEEPAVDDETQFDSQYYRANTNPTDRYVLSLPGTLKYSISPLDNTYDNFSVAGDWTACGHQAGCVEAAVMSGLLAAHSICGSPSLHDIVGYDHP